MKRILSFFVCLLALAATLPAWGEPGLQPQLSVYPTLFELDLAAGAVNESITVKNLKKRPVTMRVELYPWTFDEKDEFKLVPPSPNTLDQWMLVNPLRFTIAPGGQQTVRFAIRPRVRPEPGEHRAILYLIEEADPGIKAEGVQILARYGIGVYAYAPPVVHESKLTIFSCDLSTKRLTVCVKNQGNVHARLRGRYVIWKKKGFPGLEAMRKLPETFAPDRKPDGLASSGILAGDPVLPGRERRYSLKLDIPKEGGPYVVAVVAELDGQPVERVFE
jgi:fimbrial chaperone protein